MADSKDLPIPHPVIDDGGPAFPLVCDDCVRGGMTLRDYFAGQALAAIVSKTPVIMSATHAEHKARSVLAAVGAYNYADAMIAARKGGVA